MAQDSGDGTARQAELDVAIVGGGACGLTAALAARDAGARVALFERAAGPGGNSALSSGMIPACGTRQQRDADILDDTPKLMAADIQARAGGRADPALLALMCRTAGGVIDWLVVRHDLRLELVAGPPYPGHSRQRTHAPPGRTGAELVADLARAASAAGVDMLCNATVEELLRDPDDPARVAGFVLRRPDGSGERIACRALILAGGGFGANRALLSRHMPDVAGGHYFGDPGNRGDAIGWGGAMGAAFRDMDAYQGHAAIATPHGILLSWTVMSGGGILVNSAARRFADESLGSSVLAPDVLAQPGGTAWAIYDARLHDRVMAIPDYRQLAELGAIREGRDAAEIAGRCGLPAVDLAATLEAIAAGAPDPFGRDFGAAPALAPPYRAVRVTGGLLHTQGGLVVDERARVLAESGVPLPNLFAGGGAACGVSGPGHKGYLSGNGLLSAVSLGYVAGCAAAEWATGTNET